MLTIAQLTIREAWRKKLFWLAFGLGLAFLILFTVGFYFVLDEVHASYRPGQSRTSLILLINEISGVLLIAGLFAVNFLVVMMTALTSVATIAGEIDSHTIQSLATKPIHRMEIVLGKWLGYATMLTLYVLFMAGGLISIVYFSSGYTPPNVMLGISLLILEGLVVLSLSIFGGTFFPTLGNGVMVFMLYGIAFIGGWVEQIGAAMESETAVQIGIIASLLMPSEALWRMVSDYMMPPIVDMLTAGPFTAFSKPSSAMIIYAVIYVVVLLSGALIQFNRRDL